MFVGRDVESVLMFLGVVYSGNFYVPIHRELPSERIKVMVDSLQPNALLGRSEDSPVSKGKEGFSIPFLGFEEMKSGEMEINTLHAARRDSLDTDPLYAIFTSGSTGIPKAVLVGHRSVIDLAEAYRDAFVITESSICGNQASFDFDMSVKDIYSGLLNGCRVEIIPKRLGVFQKRRNPLDTLAV